MSRTAGNPRHSGNVVSLPRALRAPPLLDPDTWLTAEVVRAMARRLAAPLRRGEATPFFVAVGNVLAFRDEKEREAHNGGVYFSKRWNASHEAANALEAAVFAAPAENVSALWGKAFLLAESLKTSEHPDDAARLAEIARGLDRLARKWPDLALPVLDE
jgi:hypothetical protein